MRIKPRTDRERGIEAQALVDAFTGNLSGSLKAYVEAREFLAQIAYRQGLYKALEQFIWDRGHEEFEILSRSAGPCEDSPPIFDSSCRNAQQELDRHKGGTEALKHLNRDTIQCNLRRSPLDDFFKEEESK